MAVLVYIESEENKFKKTAHEALSYGKALADKMGVKVSGLVINTSFVSIHPLSSVTIMLLFPKHSSEDIESFCPANATKLESYH